jgi:hypothetical protein
MRFPLLPALALLAPALRAELRVPAHTAYVQPDPRVARVHAEGISRWSGPDQSVFWAGELTATGHLTARVVVAPPTQVGTRLRLTVGETAAEREVPAGAVPVEVDFGSFPIPAPGYVRFVLTALNPAGADNGRVQELVLDGPAVQDAHFNLKPRRNSASVHLAYPLPDKQPVEWFYAEAMGVEDPVATFYMACGFSRGYFGMQVNSPTERRIIFSVWDSGEGGSADRRDQVKPENHVQLVAKGEGVHTQVFGGEGTGGHSHLKYLWKTGSTQRFAVRAEPRGDHTIYSGYWHHPEDNRWMLIASFDAPKDGQRLRGLYSFVENFGGDTGHLRRKARFGNVWVRTAEGKDLPILRATFSHDATGKADRRDRFGGVEEGWFFLSNGGFVPGFSRYGDPFDLPAHLSPIAPVWPAP